MKMRLHLPKTSFPYPRANLLFNLTLGSFPAEGLGVEGLSIQFPFEAPGLSGLGEP